MVDGGAEVVGSFVRIAVWMFVLGLVVGLVLGVRAGLAWDGDLVLFDAVVGAR
jgi:hypothetical protein